jgi:hypothetical protein
MTETTAFVADLRSRLDALVAAARLARVNAIREGKGPASRSE